MLNTIRKHPYLFLLLLAAYLYLIGNQLIPITDPVESNYALTAREMVLSGDWLSPQIYGRYWYDKPIFYYWELALSFTVFGFNQWAARFPAAFLGCLNVLFIFWFARRVYDEATAWASALILGLSFEFWLLSKAVITDGALFFFMSAAIAFFYLGYQGERRYYYLSWLAAGLAVLTKGPIGLLLPGFSCLLFLLWKRDLRELAHVHLASGLLLFTLVGGSWYFFMVSVHGRDFLLNFLGVHNFLRAVVAEHERHNVWYFYILIFFAGFAPWSFLLPTALYRRWQQRRQLPPLEEVTVFLLCWAFSVLLVFQLVATKYTTYTFPSLFAFSLLAGRLWRHRLSLVAKACCGLGAVYTVLALLVAPLATNSHSSASMGFSLAQLDTDARPILFYDCYRTSAVFYSGKPILRLRTAEDKEASKPGGLNWKAKNVMPVYTEEELAAGHGQQYFVIVPAGKKDDFLENHQGQVETELATDRYDILTWRQG